MIATIAPGATASEHTLGTLRYAQRVRSFSVRPARSSQATRRLDWISSPTPRRAPDESECADSLAPNSARTLFILAQLRLSPGSVARCPFTLRRRGDGRR